MHNKDLEEVMAITEDVDVDHSPLRDVDLVKQLTEITLNR